MALVDVHDFPVGVGEHRVFAGAEHPVEDDLLVLVGQVGRDLEVGVVSAAHAGAAAPGFFERVDLLGREVRGQFLEERAVAGLERRVDGVDLMGDDFTGELVLGHDRAGLGPLAPQVLQVRVVLLVEIPEGDEPLADDGLGGSRFGRVGESEAADEARGFGVGALLHGFGGGVWRGVERRESGEEGGEGEEREEKAERTRSHGEERTTNEH